MPDKPAPKKSDPTEVHEPSNTRPPSEPTPRKVPDTKEASGEDASEEG